MIRFIHYLLLCILCLALGFSGAWIYHRYSHNERIQFYPNIAQVKAISQLASLHLELTQIESFEDKGWFVDTSASYYICASLLLGVDLGQLKISVDKAQKILTIELALPMVLSIQINHQRSHLISKQDYTFGVIPRLGVINTDPKNQVPDKAYLLAQQSMRKLASSQQYVEKAQKQIEQILQQMYQPFSWQVKIRWI